MSVTIYEDDNGGGYSYQFFAAPEDDLSDIFMNFYLYQSWNDEVSSLYATESVTVWEDAGYQGDSATLLPGFHDLDDLNAYGIDNDSISSLYIHNE
jgi:hypothetical protein